MYANKIEKEEIIHLQIQKVENTKTSEDKNILIQNLNKGAILGNTEKSKCRIVFQSDQGKKYVETTIWAVTDKYICLKGGISLLIASIIEVIL